MLVVKVDGLDVFDNLKNGNKKIEKAVYFAKKRALQSAKTEMQRDIVKTYDTTQKAIRDRINLNVDEGEILVKGSPIRMFKFKVTPRSPRRQLVTVSIKRDKKTLPNAFVQRLPNGTVGVFERKNLVFDRNDKDRYKIRQLYSVSVAQMAGDSNVIDGAIKRAQIVFNERMEHEMERMSL